MNVFFASSVELCRAEHRQGGIRGLLKNKEEQTYKETSFLKKHIIVK